METITLSVILISLLINMSVTMVYMRRVMTASPYSDMEWWEPLAIVHVFATLAEFIYVFKYMA